MIAWLILATHSVASWVDGFTDERHLTTDPACARYRAPRPGSRLDRISRGVSCTPCLRDAAFGWGHNMMVADVRAAIRSEE